MLATRVSTRMLYASRNNLQGSNCAKHQQNRFCNTNKSFFDRWFSVPKGFKKFYPKEGKGSSGPSSSSEAGAKNAKDKGSEAFKASSNNGKKGGSGKGGGGDPDSDPIKEIWKRLPLIMGASLAAAVFVASGLVGDRNEISWQEFKNQYLDEGRVKQIVVVNKQYAKAILNDEAILSDSNFDFKDNAFNTHDDANFKADGTKEEAHQTQVSENDAARKFLLERRLNAAQNKIKCFSIGSVESFERRMDEAQQNIPGKNQVPVTYETEGELFKEFLHLVPTILLFGFIAYGVMSAKGSGGGGLGSIFQAGKINAKKVKKESMTTTFKDVAGCDGAKLEVMEFVEFLKNPKKFSDLGASIPKGALLAGPPGTGKTLLAKATAGEADVPFYSISGSDFVEMFVGVGASRVRDLFKEARANAPCIIFIDEIDAVGRARGKGGSNDERENTLNQLLIEMDGFGTDTNVIMLAGTNRADMLDSALTRPGRFDRTIAVELPDIKGRKQIYDVHLRKIKLEKEIEEFSPRLAALTPGFSGADIANLCNEAAITAGRENASCVTMAHFEKATDRIIGGLESTKLISPEERKIVAYHEAGHAVAGWFLEHASPLLKVTIVPRSKGSLGFAQYLPKEVSLRTKTQIMDIVCMALAGRAAEQVHFGSFTTGASDDLNKVTKIIYEMVQVYGMNDKVGQLAFPKEQNGGWPQDRAYSESTAEVMDEEVRLMVAEAYERTIALMELHKDSVALVAELLMKEETISHLDVAKLIGDRKFSAGVEYDEYLFHKRAEKEEESVVVEVIIEDDKDQEDKDESGPVLLPV